MKTSEQIVKILADKYREYAVACAHFRFDGDDRMALAYAEKRAAIYEALYLIADFDDQLVAQWLSNGCED